MAGFKNKLGPIKVCLERDQVNALLSMLDTMVVGGSECVFGDMAKALRDKITRYGKPIRRGDMDEVLIYFFDNEAEKMISLMEELQAENEQLAKDLKVCRDEFQACQETLAQKTQELDGAMSLNEILNSENRKLTQQISSWNGLHS